MKQQLMRDQIRPPNRSVVPEHFVLEIGARLLEQRALLALHNHPG